uniref:Copper transport protein n=1 Tax=Opuntia streptacantha TaxID=393608 RepID=A0A7C8ZKA3_OPUST
MLRQSPYAKTYQPYTKNTKSIPHFNPSFCLLPILKHTFLPRKIKSKSTRLNPHRTPNSSNMMHMTLYWGTKVTLLFDWWKTESWPSYYLTLLFCFLFAAFYQYLEDQRLSLLALATKTSSGPCMNTPLLPSRFGTRLTNPARIGTAALFGVNSAIGYLLMLAVMSFNGGVFIAVVLGLAVGYFLFRAKEYEAVIVEDSCACA